MTPTGLVVFDKEVVVAGAFDVAGTEQEEEMMALPLVTRSTKGNFSVSSTTL